MNISQPKGHQMKFLTAWAVHKTNGLIEDSASGIEVYSSVKWLAGLADSDTDAH